MNNGDKFRLYTNEELALILFNILDEELKCKYCNPVYRVEGKCNGKCLINILDFLNTECEP